MNCFVQGVSIRLVAALALCCVTGGLRAQPASCSSDGQPRPSALLERFINAACEACWRDAATPAARRGAAALDWVLPGATGEEAPLSAVASRDGLQRLEGGSEVSASAYVTRRIGHAALLPLRVAHGVALSGYIGVSIAMKRPPAALASQPLTAWLALVETLPAGTEGSPVERNLIKNVLQSRWNGRSLLSKDEQAGFYESRAMSVAEGVHADRLRVIGWVEDARGRVIAAAQSRCPADNK